MDSQDEIEREYKDGDLSLIDAVERLQKLGMSPKEAELLIDDWDLEEADEDEDLNDEDEE